MKKIKVLIEYEINEEDINEMREEYNFTHEEDLSFDDFYESMEESDNEIIQFCCEEKEIENYEIRFLRN